MKHPLAGLLALALSAPAAGCATTDRVSVTSAEAESDSTSLEASISADGRFVAFTSYAENLFSGDTNGVADVYLRDRRAGTTERVSVDDMGAQLDIESRDASISADGRYVAFDSVETRCGSCAFGVVHVRDRESQRTEEVSVSSGEARGDRPSRSASISADGRFVAFTSAATNLVGGDTNGFRDIFVRDRLLGQTERVNVSSAEAQSNESSDETTISADGRFVAFQSYAANLVSGDTNGDGDLFVHDRQTGQTARVNVSSAGAQARGDPRGGLVFHPDINADGRFVAFESGATNLVGGDSTGSSDVFVRDRQADRTERVSVNGAGVQGNDASTRASISADGRFVAFMSEASNLVRGDTNGEVDVFVHDRLADRTERVSLSSAGAQASGLTPAISFSGRFVAFVSASPNLVGGDTNGLEDVFVRDRGQ